MKVLLPLAGRYAPLGALIAIQLLIVAIAPSVAPSALAGAAGAGTAANGSTANGASGTTGGGAAGAANGTTGAGGGGTTGSAGNLPSAVSGDTTHCIGGAEFDRSIAWFAPACVPGTPGGVDAANGGATYRQGVSGNQIEIVDYVTNYGAEINAILSAQQALVTFQMAQQYDAVVQRFLNDHFVTYGRKIHIDTYNGTCNYLDDQCILPEIDRVVSQYHPYMVFWLTSVCPECFAEIAHDGAIAIGGLGFSDSFGQQLAPFYYSATMSSTRMELAFAKWWCSEMSSANDPSRKTSFAGNNNPAQQLNGQPRRLGIVSPNKPDNENTINNVLIPALVSGCGESSSYIQAHTYFYAQDINTAAQQTYAGTAKEDSGPTAATSVVCICDIVAPEFAYQGSANANYWPESLIADVQGMGDDVAAQPYDASFSCPSQPSGPGPGQCAADSLAGLTVIEHQEPQSNDPGIRVWKEYMGDKPMPKDAGSGSVYSGATATSTLIQYVMMAALIENAGPQLDPWTMQKRAPLIPAIGGGNVPVLQFGPGNYQWIQTAREVYWDHWRKSSYNAKPGTWIAFGGGQDFSAGNPYASDASGPPCPPPDKRS
ncbi:MAG TPA: hypothetical protein VF137_09545 [Candidatus Dormibacteraeota bacterium]